MDVILLDELSEKINSLNNGLTNTVASINNNVNEVKNTVNNIYSKVDTEIVSVLTNTNTNNTGSLTGTLSQKLTTIANSLVGAVNGTGGTYNQGTVHAKLATIILNQCTSFVAGNSIVKYEPIKTKTKFTNTSSYIIYNYDSGSSKQFYIQTINPYKTDVIKRNGTVRISFSGSSQYYEEYFGNVSPYLIISKQPLNPKNNYSSSVIISYFNELNDKIKTVDIDVSVGNVLYFNIASPAPYAQAYDYYVNSLKVSYDIVTNTNIL